jgi:hypothetical protein
MRVKTFLLLTVLCLACAANAAAQTNQSQYTTLTKCKTLKSTSAEGGSYVGICPGIAGYKLQLEEGDLRQNIQVITPGGQKHSLELWNVIASGFSTVGPQAEWRVQKKGGKLMPVALIVRFNASNPENPSKNTSYLSVSKITPEKICVTNSVPPGAKANVAARQAADNAANQPCLEPNQ